MSLIGALNLGKSALAVHQAAIQVTSNNVANAGNANYTRQVAGITPARDYQLRSGIRVGGGVNLDSIQRQIDESLEGRIRDSMSDSASAQVRQEWLGRVEAIFGELGDNDLSSQLSAFFNSWSSLANKPQDAGLRQIVLQSGESLAAGFHTIRGQLDDLQQDMNQRLGATVREADALASQVAQLNEQIARAEGGAGPSANALRDQRDAVLKKLSEMLDVKVQDNGDGMVNVYLGSESLVMGATSRGLALKEQTVNGVIEYKLVIADDNSPIDATSGQLGGLLGLRSDLAGTIDDVDTLASNLIFELNKLHSSGQGLQGFSQVTGTNAVQDANAALNSAEAGLPFTPTTGSFVIHVRHTGSGLTSSTLVQMDLDGLNGDDTTLSSLAATIDAVGGISASVVAGKLNIQSDSGDLQISFSQDSSGTLAALGINSFFTGRNAADIGVNGDLKTRPTLLAAARNGEPADNQMALAIAALESNPLSALSGASLKERYEAVINSVANQAAGAKVSAEAAANIQETFLSQREALSGVSMDEEAVNLIRQQRAFQGAAKIIAVVDEMMRTLLQMV